MTISIPKETHEGETRAALVPEHVGKLVKTGAQVLVEHGAGLASGHSDEAYTAAGATVENRDAVLAGGDLFFTVRGLPASDIPKLKSGALLAGLLDPFNSPESVKALAFHGISALSMELLPRTTKAQKMDVLSSQASLAGYVAVILAAEHSPRIFPMMMTPAGTLLPSKVFIIGAGVAGLQAIATAKRLGAKVEAYDTRPVVEEQVKSLGARFVTLDLGGETGQTKDGRRCSELYRRGQVHLVRVRGQLVGDEQGWRSLLQLDAVQHVPVGLLESVRLQHGCEAVPL